VITLASCGQLSHTEIATRLGLPTGTVNGRMRLGLPELIPLLTKVTHWGYGTGWGTAYGLAAGRARRSPGVMAGAALGTVVWLMSYVQLVPMGLYDPP
jgi:hypothetical protein